MGKKLLFSFPGIVPEDNLLSMLKLMSSKNPSNDISAQTASGGGVCQKINENEKFWRENQNCDSGFVPDYANGYCYKVLPEMKSFDEGDDYCEYFHDAELLLFDKPSEVDGFIDLIEKGILGNLIQFKKYKLDG